LDDILWAYTLDQLKVFCEAGRANDKAEMLNNASMNRAAYHYDRKQWDEITKIFNGKENKPEEKTISKQNIAKLKQLARR